MTKSPLRYPQFAFVLLICALFTCGVVKSDRDSRLIAAVSRKDAPAVRALLDAGADPNQCITCPEWDVDTGLRPASDLIDHDPNFWRRIVHFVADKTQATESTRRCVPILFSAASYKDPEIGIALIDHGARVNVEMPYEGDTPLIMAAVAGDIPLVERLLRAGATVRRISIHGPTVIQAAVSRTAVCGDGNKSADDVLRLLEILIHAGADVNERDRFGDIALYTYRPPTGKRDPVVIYLMRRGVAWPETAPGHLVL